METSFPQFERLPPEIRRLIWDATLPIDDDGPALCLFGWRWYIQFFDANNEMEEFKGVDHQPYIQVPMPAAVFVCREAREVVGPWMVKRNLTMRLREETQGHILVREWDREKDPVYVSLDLWEEFKSLQEDWDDGIEELGASITHLALPAFTAYFSIETLSILLEWMPNLLCLYIIWGELPVPRTSRIARPPNAPEGHRYEVEVQPRWELEAEDSEMVKMCSRDPNNGKLAFDPEEELAGYKDDMEQQWSISEVPEQFVDDEIGALDLSLDHMKLKERGVDDWYVADQEDL